MFGTCNSGSYSQRHNALGAAQVVNPLKHHASRSNMEPYLRRVVRRIFAVVVNYMSSFSSGVCAIWAVTANYMMS